MKIVSAKEMQRIEKLSFAEGHTAAEFMDRAADGIAKAVEKLVYDTQLSRQILLVTGKGNNAADKYTAGTLLLAKGFSVQATTAFPIKEYSPLCRERYDRFIKQGGKVISLEKVDPQGYALILDGLVGTGFEGEAEGTLARLITWCNNTQIPIIAIDIPSGLNGTTGEIGSVAIHAFATLYLGLPKIGFFLNQGWDVVGKLIGIDFGLPSKMVEKAHEVAHLLETPTLKLPPIQRSRHKYEAGYVLGVAGSEEMPGAAALATEAVLRSGAGIVRLFTDHPQYLKKEVIREKYSLSRIKEEAKRASAYFIGPGLGREPLVKKRLKALLGSVTLPAVIDGDALFFLGESQIPKKAILTPHQGEMERLLKKKPTFENCQHYAEKHKTTLVLKGAPTIIFHPQKKPVISTQGDPGMATAGTGDVLTGIIAGLLAQKMEPDEAAILGVYLHGIAGELAADDLTSYCMIASDLLDDLPTAFASLDTR